MFPVVFAQDLAFALVNIAQMAIAVQKGAYGHHEPQPVHPY